MARNARKPKLFVDRVWSDVSAICEQTGSKTIVIAYLGNGAKKMLKIKNGDVVVTCASDASIIHGATSAAELQRIADAGATIYNVDNLHAKVIITKSRLVVGSANASTNSKNGLIEACLSTTDQGAIGSAEIWARSLFGDELSDEQILRKMTLKVKKRVFTGVRAKSVAGVPEHAPLWLGYTDEEQDDEEFNEMSRAEEARLNKTLDTTRFETDTRFWPYTAVDAVYHGVRVDDQIIDIDHTTNSPRVYPPARVIKVEEHRKDGRTFKFVYLERPLQTNSLTLANFKRRAAAVGLNLQTEFPSKGIRNPLVAHRLRQLWT